MSKILGRLFSALGNVQVLWAILPSAWQAWVTAVVSAVSGVLVFSESGLGWAIFAAAGVFAFTAAGFYYAHLFIGVLSTFERLTVNSIGLIQVGVRTDESKEKFSVVNLTLQCKFKNVGLTPLYMKLVRFHHSIEGHTRPGANVDSEIHFVAPHTESAIILPTIQPPIKLGDHPLKGEVELEAIYGPASDDLRYVFKYKGEPQIGYQINKEEGKTEFKITTAVITQSHERK